MRTTVEIDDRLMKEVMELTGLKTKRAVVIHALEELIRERGLGEDHFLSSKRRIWLLNCGRRGRILMWGLHRSIACTCGSTKLIQSIFSILVSISNGLPLSCGRRSMSTKKRGQP